jgi:hypothetical protein
MPGSSFGSSASIGVSITFRHSSGSTSPVGSCPSQRKDSSTLRLRPSPIVLTVIPCSSASTILRRWSWLSTSITSASIPWAIRITMASALRSRWMYSLTRLREESRADNRVCRAPTSVLIASSSLSASSSVILSRRTNRMMRCLATSCSARLVCNLCTSDARPSSISIKRKISSVA